MQSDHHVPTVLRYRRIGHGVDTNLIPRLRQHLALNLMRDTIRDLSSAPPSRLTAHFLLQSEGMYTQVSIPAQVALLCKRAFYSFLIQALLHSLYFEHLAGELQLLEGVLEVARKSATKKTHGHVEISGQQSWTWVLAALN